MNNEKVKIVSEKIIKCITDTYNDELGFADAYVLTKLNLEFSSLYNFISANFNEMVPYINEAFTDLSGMTQFTVFEFVDNKDINLYVIGLSNNLKNEREVMSLFNGTTIKEAIALKKNTFFCVPLLFKYDVNLDKAYKWIRHKISAKINDPKLLKYIDFGETSGVVRHMYLRRKGETLLDGVYRDIISEVYRGKMSISIDLGDNIVQYKGLNRKDLQDALDDEFGTNGIQVDTFECISVLSDQYKLVVSMINPISVSSCVKLRTIRSTYESIIKPALKDIGRYDTYIRLNYSIGNKNDNLLSVLDSVIKEEIGGSNNELRGAINTEWIENNKDCVVIFVNSK